MATKGGRTDGYGWAHEQLRKWWAPKVARGNIPCWRCGKIIAPDQPWDLGHDDHDRSITHGPECWPCNRGEPSRRRQREAAGIDAAPKPITQW